MNSIHAIRREHQRLRLVQAKAVMPKIGPLLDAWEGMPNDLKGELEETCPELCECIEAINTAMEDAPETESADRL